MSSIAVLLKPACFPVHLFGPVLDLFAECTVVLFPHEVTKLVRFCLCGFNNDVEQVSEHIIMPGVQDMQVHDFLGMLDNGFALAAVNVFGTEFEERHSRLLVLCIVISNTQPTSQPLIDDFVKKSPVAEAGLLSDVVRELVFYVLGVLDRDNKLCGEIDVVLPISVVADVVNANSEHSVLLCCALCSRIDNMSQPEINRSASRDTANIRLLYNWIGVTA